VSSADQVVFVLQLALALGPLAVYFLGLGLVNSRARPCLVNARTDFVLLAIALIPIIICPVVTFIEYAQFWLAVLLVLAVTILFAVLLPKQNAGWVIYNIDPECCRRRLERTCKKLGWELEWGEDDLYIRAIDMKVSFSVLPWLRNVTIYLHNSVGEPHRACEQLIDVFADEIGHESMLPSPTGASLVVIGGALLGLPMWYLFHHMDAVVDVVKRILMA